MGKATFMAHTPGSRAQRGTVEVQVPTVVGVTMAAMILKVPKSNVSRLRSQGRMPDPVPRPDGDTGAPVWLLGPVEVLAAELAAERATRDAAREPEQATA